MSSGTRQRNSWDKNWCRGTVDIGVQSVKVNLPVARPEQLIPLFKISCNNYALPSNISNSPKNQHDNFPKYFPIIFFNEHPTSFQFFYPQN